MPIFERQPSDIKLTWPCPHRRSGVAASRELIVSLLGKAHEVESRSGAVAGDPFPLPAHRTGRAVFRHPALGQDVTPSPTGNSSGGRPSGPDRARCAGIDRDTVTYPDSSACACPGAIDGAVAACSGQWLDTKH